VENNTFLHDYKLDKRIFRSKNIVDTIGKKALKGHTRYGNTLYIWVNRNIRMTVAE